MLGRIYAIGLNTFREATRHWVLYGVIIVVLLLNMGGLILAEMSLNQHPRVARNVGLFGMSFFGAFTAIYLGVRLLYGEIERKTIYNIVSKPIARFEFVLGKYLGMVMSLSLLVVAFGMAMLLQLVVQDVAFSSAVLKALLMGYAEVLVVAAIAIFFSSFSTPFLSGIFTFLIYFLGRVTPEIRAAAEQASSEVIRTVADLALRPLPDLHLFSISGASVDGTHVTVHGDFVGWDYVGVAGGWAVLYIGALLVLSVAIFNRRNFT